MGEVSQASIRTPDQRLRVFVSSTLNELAGERAAVRDAILELRLSPVMFEAGARPHPATDLYRAYLAQSQVFIGIYAQSYGWIGPGMSVSGLEDEYELSTDKPRLIYVKDIEAEREPNLDALLDRIRADGSSCYAHFRSADELRERVADDLAHLLSEFAIADTTRPGPEPDRPSIAVLPFDTLGDPSREAFADGLVEDLITGLSHCHDLFVIARTSTSKYKNTQVDVRAAARTLGVRYLLEGSVRWAGDQARITAQLIDGSTGGHVWARHYDQPVDDMFSVIDTITDDVVAHLSGYHGMLVLTDKKRTLARDPGSLSDYEAYMRGLELKHRFMPDTNLEARQIFVDVLARRPAFARAHVALAWTWLFDVWWGWSETPDESLANAWRHAERALELDSLDAEVHWLLGDLSMVSRQYERAEAEYRRSFELNPSLADVRASWASTANRLGLPEEGVESMELAKRLNPNHPVWYGWFHGAALYGAHRYEEAERVLRAVPIHTVVSRLYLAAALARLGKLDDAEREVASAREALPAISTALLEHLETYRSPEGQAHLSEAVRLAGLPES